MSLDFEKFATDAIKILDELRSTGADPKRVDSNSSKPVESRINTFYRAIGLPAFTTDEKIEDREFNSGNLHPNNNDQTIKTYLDEAQEREINFSDELTKEEQENFLDKMEENILSSTKRSKKDGRRKKGGLFPMIVNGNIRIMPQNKRVRGAFFQKNSDLKVGGATYHRPLIETIVLLRLSGQGYINSEDRSKLQDSFPKLVENSFFEGSGENILTIQILESLLNAVVDPDGIKKVINSTINKLGRIRKQIQNSFEDSRDATVAEEQPKVGESNGNGKFEKQAQERGSTKAENDAMITLLEYDDTFGSFDVGKEVTRNMKDALFSQMILETILSDTKEIDKTINEDKVKKENLERPHKKYNKLMDLFLGTYSGISGIDVLVVITALFSIDQFDLFGLLNKESMERLEKLKDSPDLLIGTDVKSAISVLEKKTEDIFKLMDGTIREAGISIKNRKK